MGGSRETGKRRVGRPMKWGSVEELQKQIDQYFRDYPDPQDWTITGLALYLDTTRDTILDYAAKPEFSDTIRIAKEKIHMSYEMSLKKRGNSGDIFALKNFGWRDDQNVNVGGQKDNPLTVLKIE